MSERLNYSVKEAAAALGIGRTWLYELIKTSQIKAVKIGRRTLIPADSLQAFSANLPTAKIGRDAIPLSTAETKPGVRGSAG